MKTNLQKAVDFLWENRESYRENIRNRDESYYNFDSIEHRYANLPEEIYRQLDNCEIDAIARLWCQLVGRDDKKGIMCLRFDDKKSFYSAIRKSIKEKIKFIKEKEEVILGDFLAWAIKQKYWIRGFESIHKTKAENGPITKDHPKGESGWSFVWATQCGFVSDEDIRKLIKPKTNSQWDCWGR